MGNVVVAFKNANYETAMTYQNQYISVSKQYIFSFPRYILWVMYCYS